ncbi:histamine H1 receptor-like [Limulus polyphemus]|uniref:Histamine H1 receptor-like n=1 Tax=Limulus polyphemus TaxID=6850 RepID=A0ABM1BS19_LIMPO|nr:histamine H1 receptor-like [Limulus polyphemus]
MGVSLYALSLLTFVGNAMVLHAIRTERRLQTVSNIFIMSLAIADLTVGMIVMPISSAYAITGDWMFGIVVCQFWLSVDYTASTASILNLFILSLDRYWSIRSPLKYLRKRTKKRALIMIGIVWLLSAMWIIPIIGWHYWYNDGVRKQPGDVCETEFADNVLFKLSTSTANFYVPIVLMICLYAKIFHEIKKRSKFEIGQCNTGGSQDDNRISAEENNVDSERRMRNDDERRQTCQKQLRSSFDDEYEDLEAVTKRMERPRSPSNELLRATCSRTGGGNSGRRACIRTTSRDSNTDPSFHNLAEPSFYNQKYNDVTGKTDILPASGTDTLLLGGVARKNYDSIGNIDGKRVSDLKDSRENISGKKTKLCQLKFRKSSKNFLKTKKRKNKQSLELIELYSSREPRKPDSDGYIDGSELQDHKCQRSLRRYDTVPPRPVNRSSFRPGTRLIPNITTALRMRVTRKSMASNLRQEKKAARQLGVIMGAFVLCWLPYIITFIVTAYCDDCIDPKIHTATIWLGYLNSTINPFLYALCNDNFKRAFKNMFHRGSRNSMFFPANAKPDHLFA